MDESLQGEVMFGLQGNENCPVFLIHPGFLWATRFGFRIGTGGMAFVAELPCLFFLR